MKTISAGGLNLVAQPWPPVAGRKTLVFIPGAGLTWQLWRAQMEGLAAVANTVAVDLPGHGSSPGNGLDSVAGYAALVAQAMEELNLPQPIPCGLSLGGAVAQQLLADYPDRFAGGVLINTGARLRVLPLIFEALKENKDDFLELIFHSAIAEKNRTETTHNLLSEIMDCPPEVAAKDFAACDAFDIMERLQLIKVPVLVVGSAEDTTTPLKYASYLADHIEQAKLITIAEAAHLAPLEKPVEINEAIIDFLSQL